MNLRAPQTVLLLIFLAAIFLFSFNQLQEFDAWFHLKTGEYIVKNFTIPTTDIFSYTAAGKPWITHSWLAEAIFYGIYLIGGLFGLAAFAALMAALTYYLVIRLALKLGANFYAALFIAFFPAYLTQALWVPRPQIFSYLFLVLLLSLLESSAMRPRWQILSIIFLILLWANTHASVILGLAVLVFYALWQKRFIIPAAAGAVISFLNPNTYKIFTYQFAVLETVRALRVEEWYSILYFIDRLGAQVFLGMLIALAIFVVIVFRRPKWTLLFLGVSILPFISIRHVGFFPLVAVPIVSLGFSELKIIKNLLEKIRPGLIQLVFFLSGTVLVLAGVLYLPKSIVNEETLPVKAADFIERENIQGPMFNLYNEGGYLIWRLWPKQRVFMDGRSEVYGGEPLRDILTIVNLRYGWQNLVDEKYKINYFILPYRPPFFTLTGDLMRALTRRGFKTVYWDDAHVILLRDAPLNQEIIAKYVTIEK
jgi:hypothetical protein